MASRKIYPQKKWITTPHPVRYAASPWGHQMSRRWRHSYCRQADPCQSPQLHQCLKQTKPRGVAPHPTLTCEAAGAGGKPFPPTPTVSVWSLHWYQCQALRVQCSPVRCSPMAALRCGFRLQHWHQFHLFKSVKFYWQKENHCSRKSVDAVKGA